MGPAASATIAAATLHPMGPDHRRQEGCLELMKLQATHALPVPGVMACREARLPLEVRWEGQEHMQAICVAMVPVVLAAAAAARRVVKIPIIITMMLVSHPTSTGGPAAVAAASAVGAVALLAVIVMITMPSLVTVNDTDATTATTATNQAARMAMARQPTLSLGFSLSLMAITALFLFAAMMAQSMCPGCLLQLTLAVHRRMLRSRARRQGPVRRCALHTMESQRNAEGALTNLDNDIMNQLGLAPVWGTGTEAHRQRLLLQPTLPTILRPTGIMPVLLEATMVQLMALAALAAVVACILVEVLMT